MLRLLLCTLPFAAVIAWVAADPSDGASRGMLWRVVQACVLNHSLTGSAFPCLDVDTSHGLARGYAVIRSPLERVRLVVAPTARTSGIESARLRGADAADYFHDAWTARRFVVAALPHAPRRADLAMAINSRWGRSQDQLHIHVACIRPQITVTLATLLPSLAGNGWQRIKVLPHAPAYWARFVPSDDLAGVNVFDAVAKGLAVPQEAMRDVTIAVVGTEAARAAIRTIPAGFVILARKRIPHSADDAHGESLLDDDCAAFAGR